MITKKFRARGTTCQSCAEIIKDQALKVNGVKEVDFDLMTEIGTVTFDPEKTNIDTILDNIEEKGYSCTIGKEQKEINYLGWIFAIMGFFVAGYFLLRFVNGINFPKINAEMSYGLLFLVGLITGFHCISMCGGFVISYTTKNAKEGLKNHKSHLMYGLGKLVSYTLIGAIFGLVGSIVAFTPIMRGIIGIVAGGFLILFGLKMLNIFPILRKIQFKTPKFITKFIGQKQKNASPLIIGLLNGLMIACGPLQAIYILAAGTGNFIEGAKLLFIFGLGTLPVMLGFGYFTSLVSNKMTNKILKFSGTIVIILGLIMVNNGLTLSGQGYDFNSVMSSITGNSVTTNANIAIINDGYQEIYMDVDRNGWAPNTFVLEKNVPVKWIINGKELTGCNNAIQVPKLGLYFDIEKGEQIIEFVPTEEGTISWSCWMGMINGAFIIKDNIDSVTSKEIANIDIPKSAGCGCKH